MLVVFAVCILKLRDTMNKGIAVDSTRRKSVTEQCVKRLTERFTKNKEKGKSVLFP